MAARLGCEGAAEERGPHLGLDAVCANDNVAVQRPSPFEHNGAGLGVLRVAWVRPAREQRLPPHSPLTTDSTRRPVSNTGVVLPARGSVAARRSC